MVCGAHEKEINVLWLFWDVCAVHVGGFFNRNFAIAYWPHLQVPSSLIFLDSPSTTH